MSVTITVAVDNTLTFQSVPRGVVEQTPAGSPQRTWHDFFNYAEVHVAVVDHAVVVDHGGFTRTGSGVLTCR